MVKINAHAALDLRRKDFQDPACSGADIQKGFDFFTLKGFQKALFNIGLGHVKRTDTVPVGGIGAKIFGCFLGPGVADHPQPLQVTGMNRIIIGDQINQGAGKMRGFLILHQTVKRPGPFLEP